MPSPTPASSCPNCYRPGTLVANQLVTGRKDRTRSHSLRFECLHCITEWTANKADAEEHGRFIARITKGAP